jgi:hypothetical protein
VVLPATENHRFDGGTTDGNGVVTYTCTVCGHTRTEEPQPTEPVVPTPPGVAPTEPETVPGSEPTEPRPTEPGNEKPAVAWAWVPVVLFALAATLIFVRRKKKE